MYHATLRSRWRKLSRKWKQTSSTKKTWSPSYASWPHLSWSESPAKTTKVLQCRSWLSIYKKVSQTHLVVVCVWNIGLQLDLFPCRTNIIDLARYCVHKQKYWTTILKNTRPTTFQPNMDRLADGTCSWPVRLLKNMQTSVRTLYVARSLNNTSKCSCLPPRYRGRNVLNAIADDLTIICHAYRTDKASFSSYLDKAASCVWWLSPPTGLYFWITNTCEVWGNSTPTRKQTSKKFGI